MDEAFDAHFHLWDVDKHHDKDILGEPAETHPRYTAKHLDDSLSEADIKLVGAIHVEAIAEDAVAEAEWAQDMAKDAGFPIYIVARVDLSQPDAGQQLQILKDRIQSLRGIRQILNYEPSWPKVDQQFLKNPVFVQNYALLGKHGLSFDLQVNPHQLKDAAALAAKHPEIPVIINHLGCLKLSGTPDEDAVALETWRSGMKAMADAGSHVFVKISMLGYTHSHWDNDTAEQKEGSLDLSALSPTPFQFMQQLFNETLTMFGPQRCMFASNYPVDDALGWPPHRLWQGFRKLAAKLTPDERHWLFVGSAKKAYRC